MRARPHYVALDGMRAVAVGIVLLGHAGVPWVQPHFTGVAIAAAILIINGAGVVLSSWKGRPCC